LRMAGPAAFLAAWRDVAVEAWERVVRASEGEGGGGGGGVEDFVIEASKERGISLITRRDRESESERERE
jgi:hypothetical protein